MGDLLTFPCFTPAQCKPVRGHGRIQFLEFVCSKQVYWEFDEPFATGHAGLFAY